MAENVVERDGAYYAPQAAAMEREYHFADASKMGGNAAVMLEALKAVVDSATEIMERVRHKDGLAFNIANSLIGVAHSALAAPPRNCDVGTAEDQRARHRLWCSLHSVSGDMDADCVNTGCSECAITWEHMPYENGDEE